MAIGLLLALGAAACGDGTGPSGVLDDLDPDAAAAIADSLLTPVSGIDGATVSLRGAFSALVGQGVSYRRADPGPAANGLVRFPVAGDLVLPDSLTGRTWVRDSVGTWSVDSTRTDAPAGAIRVVWYRTNPQGGLAQPLMEGGYVDLTDEDAGGSLSRIGLRVMGASEGDDVALADFTEALDSTDAAQWSQAFGSTGFYGGGSRTVEFDMVSDASGDTVSGDEQIHLSVSLSSGGLAYALTIDRTGEGDTAVQDYVASVTRDGVTTRMTLDITEAQDGTQSGTGVLSHGGTDLVRIDVEGADYTYRDLDGDRLPTSEQIRVDGLVRALILTGFSAYLSLPLLFATT